MKNIIIATVFLASFMGFAMASTAGPQEGAPGHHMHSMIMRHCPMMVAGTEVVAEDTQDGVALVFTTTPGDAGELRKRVEFMSKMHNEAVKRATEARHAHMTPADAKNENIENGALIVFTPEDPSKLESLRKEVRQHAQKLANRDCSIMLPMMRETPPPEPEESESLAARERGR